MTMINKRLNRKPNLIVITAQDCGRMFGCYGAATVNTPAIDNMAREGVVCSNLYATSSLSSPSRASMFTGRYPQKNGVLGLCDEPWNWVMNDGEIHLAQLLKLDGYSTVLFRHQTETSAELWKSLGFDDFRAKEQSSRRGEKIDSIKAQTAIKVAKEVTAFFGERAYKKIFQSIPFYAQIGFFEAARPHDYGTTKRDISKGADIPRRIVANEESRNQIAALQGSINHVDKAVEIIMAGLKRSAFKDNTLVVFISPSGIEMARDKNTLYDPGVEATMILHWPEMLRPGICGSYMSSIDVAPTILDLIESDMPFNLDGLSFADAISGSDMRPLRSEVFGTHVDSRFVRTSEYKLIVNFAPTTYQTVPPVNLEKAPLQIPAPIFELYNLKTDPDEIVNIANDTANAQILRSLKVKLVDWMHKVNDPLFRNPGEYFKKAVALLLA